MKKNKALITKGRFDLKYRGTVCLNCGQPLDITDKYCPNCSQPNSTKKLVLKDFFDEFLSSLINYDSKLIKTLYTLLVKPGTITKDYIQGKRVSYTNPFKFLLTLAFLYLLMFGYTNNFSQLDELDLVEKINNNDNLNFSLSGNGTKDSSAIPTKIKNFIPLDSIDQNDPEIAINLQQLDSLDAFITENAKKKQESDSLLYADPKAYIAKMRKNKEDDFFGYVDFYQKMLRRDSLSTFEESSIKFGVPENRKTKMAFNASRSILKAIAQPGSWINNTIAKLPFVVFFFLPVFTVFIFLVYIRKNYTYTDHLIFSFHNQSLLFILLILSWIIDTIFSTATSGLALVLFATYLFQAMRRFYGQGVFKTIVKYVFLNSVFMFLALITIVLLSLGSAVTY